MFFKHLVGLLFCSIALVASESYDGFKIYDIYAKTADQKNVLRRLAENTNYDFFDLPRSTSKPARVMVQPEDLPDFGKLLKKYGLKASVINDNVGASLAKEQTQASSNNLHSKAQFTSRISFDKFQRFADINAYMDGLAKNYSTRAVVKKLGKSYENRDMKIITISNGDDRPNKKVILLDAGIHAREWIAPATALYIIHELVENYAANANLLKNYNWVILPVANPDGYEYSHTNSRMWRKTRNRNTTLCIGTDPNRNFDFHWGEVGASDSSCAETYMGKTAFSEPETKILRDLMFSLKDTAKMYLTLHSYGNYLLYPWGYTSDLPETWKDIDDVAQAGAAAINATTGTKYTVGSSTNVLYAAAGGSDDYALGVTKIPISITMELPGCGSSGFNPPPSQIDQLVKESWIGIKAMATKIEEKY